MIARRQTMARRTLLKGLVGVGAAMALAACAPAAAPQATPAPTKAAEPAKTAEPAKPSETAKPAAQATSAPAASQKPLAGQTIKCLVLDPPYMQNIQKTYLPEFQDLTGAKVEFEVQSIEVASPRIDMELAGGTGALDVVQCVFIWSGKWIGANWATDLTPLINDPQMTDKAKLDVADFVGLGPFQRGDKLYALPYQQDEQMLIYRKDIFQKNSIAKPPETFDEMIDIAKKIHSKEVAANLLRGQASLHWTFPMFLFSYGGSFFAAPPDDMTPMLNSPAAVTAAEKYTVLFRDYGVPGSVSYGSSDAQTSFNQGKAAMWLDGQSLQCSAYDSTKSTVSDKVAFAPVPAGPAGRKPQTAGQGLMIPAATKDKRKGWEFIKWALSKEMTSKQVFDKGWAAATRKSVLNSPEYDKKYPGMGAMQAQADQLAVAGGYMYYRTLPEFGPIGDALVKYLGQIVTGAQAKPVTDSLNKDVAEILSSAGYKIKKG